MRLFQERKVIGSNLGPVKSDTDLPTARHRYDISLKETVAWAQLLGDDPVNSK